MDLQDLSQGISGICGAFLLHCTGMVEEGRKMERLMKETMEEWQEMEGKEKVVCVVDEVRENGRV